MGPNVLVGNGKEVGDAHQCFHDVWSPRLVFIPVSLVSIYCIVLFLLIDRIISDIANNSNINSRKIGKIKNQPYHIRTSKTSSSVPGESTGRLTFVSAHVYVQSQYTNVSTHLHLVSCDSHTDLHFAKLSCFKLWVQYFIHSMDGSGHVDVRLSCVFCVYLESSLTGRGIVVAWWSCGGCVNMHVFVDHVISGPCRPAIT